MIGVYFGVAATYPNPETPAREERVIVTRSGCEVVETSRAIGVSTARAEGKRIGRPPRVVNLEELRRLRAHGLSIRQIALRMSIPRSTIGKRLKLITSSAQPETALQESRDGA